MLSSVRNSDPIRHRGIETGGKGPILAGFFFVPGREIKQPPLDKWIGRTCEVAEQIDSLFVKFVFQHGSPNNPEDPELGDQHVVKRTKSRVSSGALKGDVQTHC